MNDSLLQDSTFAQRIEEELAFYFETNCTAEVAPLTLWEAHKTYLRGLFIKQGAKLKKDRIKVSEELFKEMHELEMIHKQDQAADTLAKLRDLRERFATQSIPR